MLEGLASVRALKFAVAVGAALFLAACANDKAKTGAGDLASIGGGSATPGSAQDFQDNVGDRVFFESDSSDLTSTVTAKIGRAHV